MAVKELWVYLLAHNLIRMLMMQTALATGQLSRELSFKHCLQLWLAYQAHWQSARYDAPLEEFLRLMSERRVGQRPGRIEPRAVKQRPKPYPLLTKPRPEARADIARYGHPKKLK